MVKQFNRTNLLEIRVAMNIALGYVEKKFGIVIEVGGASYGQHDATFKVKLSILDEAGDSKADKSNFMSYALHRGFDTADFGRDFTSKGRQFKIVGWNRRARKYPVIVKEIATGDAWHFSVSAILRALGKAGKVIQPSLSPPTFT